MLQRLFSSLQVAAIFAGLGAGMVQHPPDGGIGIVVLIVGAVMFSLGARTILLTVAIFAIMRLRGRYPKLEPIMMGPRHILR